MCPAPGKSQRAVAVADVNRRRVGQRAVGKGARQGDNHVISAEVKLLHGHGIKRQVSPKKPLRARHLLHKGGMDLPPPEAGGPFLVNDCREDLSVGNHVRDGRDHPLSAPHVDKSLGHDRHTPIAEEVLLDDGRVYAKCGHEAPPVRTLPRHTPYPHGPKVLGGALTGARQRTISCLHRWGLDSCRTTIAQQGQFSMQCKVPLVPRFIGRRPGCCLGRAHPVRRSHPWA